MAPLNIGTVRDKEVPKLFAFDIWLGTLKHHQSYPFNTKPIKIIIKKTKKFVNQILMATVKKWLTIYHTSNIAQTNKQMQSYPNNSSVEIDNSCYPSGHKTE